MKILHISSIGFENKNFISGIKSVLLEEVKWENKIHGLSSKILVFKKPEEENSFFLYNKNIKNSILEFKPNFVIFDGFYMIQHCFIAKFLKKNNIKYYIKPHGSFNKIAQNNSKIKFVKKVVARILFFNNYVKNSNGLIFLNQMEKENSIYRKEKEFILPNGINEIEIKLNKEIKDSVNFVFLGRIDFFHKGLDILLDTILKNKEYFVKNKTIFNFYGNGKKEEINRLNSYLKKMPQIIKYHGSVYGNDKFKVLNKNDIFILISRFEGMPMGILEALAIGVPCFISKETGMEKYIKQYNAGWVNENKKNLFEDLKKCIEEIKKNSEFYKINSLKCV